MDITNIINSNDEKMNFFIASFLKIYLQNGFGRMSKTELDILIFHLLSATSLSSYSNYELSRILKVSETKVKSLKYEASLRYGNNDDDSLKREFRSIIDKNNFKVIGDKIVICIEDKLLRNYIDYSLKSIGLFSDSSFNRELMTIHSDMFLDLLKSLYGDKVYNQLDAEFKRRKIGNNFKEYLKEFLKGCSHETGKQSIKLIASLLTGGTSVVSDVIDLFNQ
jgi:hypothetical protein